MGLNVIIPRQCSSFCPVCINWGALLRKGVWCQLPQKNVWNSDSYLWFRRPYLCSVSLRAKIKGRLTFCSHSLSDGSKLVHYPLLNWLIEILFQIIMLCSLWQRQGYFLQGSVKKKIVSKSLAPLDLPAVAFCSHFSVLTFLNRVSNLHEN